MGTPTAGYATTGIASSAALTHESYAQDAGSASKAIHVVLDNYAAHKKDKVEEWLARHP